ncbi:MAG: single-stranded DNA-binding protein [Tannerellaceae bacterium]|nr:single-stranded DNA-binding protein [Tannerellaceae bacterium]
MTYFDISGTVGKVIKKEYNGKKTTFVSVASVGFYKGKATTTWVNNITFFSTLADVTANTISPGLKVRISGQINTSQKGGKERVFFVGEKFELLTFSEEKRQERLQQQAVDNLPDAEDMYTSGGQDDLPY